MLSTICNFLKTLILVCYQSDVKEPIEISGNFDVGELLLNTHKSVVIQIKNVSSKLQIFKKLIFEHNYSEFTQLINMSREMTFVEIGPEQSITLMIDCHCKILRYTNEGVIFSFEGFNIIRNIKFNAAITLESTKRSVLDFGYLSVVRSSIPNRQTNCNIVIDGTKIRASAPNIEKCYTKELPVSSSKDYTNSLLTPCAEDIKQNLSSYASETKDSIDTLSGWTDYNIVTDQNVSERISMLNGQDHSPIEPPEITLKNHKDFLFSLKQSLPIQSSGIRDSIGTLSRQLNYNIVTEPKVSERTSTLNFQNCTPNELTKLTIKTHSGIPDYLWQTYYNEVEECSLSEMTVPSILLQPLSIKNYKERFHMLVYLEEIGQNLGYKNYNELNVYMDRADIYLVMEIKDLAEKTPTLQLGDFVEVNNPWMQNPSRFTGYINKIGPDCVYLRFNTRFLDQYDGESLNVEFFASRAVYRKCHFSIDRVFSQLGPELLFPECITKAKKPQIKIGNQDVLTQGIVNNNHQLIESKKYEVNWRYNNLNVIQKQAVINILKGTLRPMPYVIYGPPGTGKTMTLVETIQQIASLIPSSKLLIVAPSNTAADLITQLLIDTCKLTTGYILRVVSINRVNNNKIPVSLRKCSATIKTMEGFASGIDKSGFYYNCNKEYIKKHKIVIGTCIGVGTLHRIGFKDDYFTHVLIDEAGQCTEPESMVALSFINKSKGQIIMSGDPLQLGPVITSALASSYGLDTSYLERLLNCIPYKRDIVSNGTENDGYNPELVTKLIYNYRSIPKIVSLFSDMFYNGSLISQLNTDTLWIRNFFKRIQSLLNLAENPGVMFYGISGESYKGFDFPSWYNPQEAKALLDVLLGLYTKNISPEDIGIVTPYKKQVEYLTSIIKDSNKPLPKIGSVEIFQGQECKIILMSTVRSHTGDGTSYQMGFVKSPKRINVALSRAKLFMIIFGDPHLLVRDPLWRKIILRIVDKHCYMGCDLPNLNKFITYNS